MAPLTAVLALLLAGPAPTAPEPRWFPEPCLAHVVDGQSGSPDGTLSRAEADRMWNLSYRLGFRAIEEGEHAVAEVEMCRALFAARQFGPRDWRFAETLDELGRIAFVFGELERAEQMQGAAVAEMLLAVGPGGEPPRSLDSSAGAVMRSDCRSGVPVYLQRLAWVYEQMPGDRSVGELQDAPWLVLAAGHVPLDLGLAQRLEWLISQYLLQENLAAAEALTRLQREIMGE